MASDTDGRSIIWRTASEGDGWEIDGPCVIRVVKGSCRLEIEADNSVTVKTLDKPDGSGYDDDDKQPTEAA